MSENRDESERQLSEDEEAVLRIVAEGRDKDVDDLTEQERNLALAQARRIGDL